MYGNPRTLDFATDENWNFIQEAEPKENLHVDCSESTEKAQDVMLEAELTQMLEEAIEADYCSSDESSSGDSYSSEDSTSDKEDSDMEGRSNIEEGWSELEIIEKEGQLTSTLAPTTLPSEVKLPSKFDVNADTYDGYAQVLEELFGAQDATNSYSQVAPSSPRPAKLRILSNPNGSRSAKPIFVKSDWDSTRPPRKTTWTSFDSTCPMMEGVLSLKHTYVPLNAEEHRIAFMDKASRLARVAKVGNRRQWVRTWSLLRHCRTAVREESSLSAEEDLEDLRYRSEDRKRKILEEKHNLFVRNGRWTHKR